MFVLQKRKAWKYFQGRYSDQDTLSCIGMATVWYIIYLCEGPEWPANLNSGRIHFVSFLTLEFIIDFALRRFVTAKGAILNINILSGILSQFIIIALHEVFLVW